MVDFNAEKTVGTPATEVEKISILQRRYDFIEAYEAYRKLKYTNSTPYMSAVRARLLSLFLECRSMLVRRLDIDILKDVEDVIYNSTDEKKLLGSFYTIDKELDIIKLTRIDLSKTYDSSDVEAENKEKSYG